MAADGAACALATLPPMPTRNWIWSPEGRRQWAEAVARWREHPNLVVLVELPAASKPEAVLLAENLPQILWVVGSGQAAAAETRELLRVLHHARCPVLGAVLNRVQSL
jgi:hypothetical protein